MNPKIIAIIIIVVVVAVLFVSCKNSNKGKVTEPQSGGIIDYSPPTPPKIHSREIKSFSIDFTLSAEFNDERKHKCPRGRYHLSLTKDGDKALCDLQWKEMRSTAEEKPYRVNFKADLSALDDLQEFIEKKKITHLNGYHKTNSALGSYLDLKVEYESAETLSAFAEGGSSVMPDTSLEYFIIFFSDLAKQNGTFFIRGLTKEAAQDICLKYTKKLYGDNLNNFSVETTEPSHNTILCTILWESGADRLFADYQIHKVTGLCVSMDYQLNEGKTIHKESFYLD